MSTVGLTTALRFAMANEGHWHPQLFMRAQRLGLIDEQGNKTPRGHAALAAPRMTQHQYELLCHYASERPILFQRGEVLLKLLRKGWLDVQGITTAGRTALNNVRAAMPGDWP